MREGAYRSFILPESTPHYQPQKDFHTEHVKIELSLDMSKKMLAGSCTLKIIPLSSGLKRLALDACGLEIKEVSLDGAPCAFEYDLEKLTVDSPNPLSGSHSLRVAYSCSPTKGVYFIEPDPEHPEREVQAWSHSEAEFARHWYPCYDHPNEKSTSEILLTVPKGFKVISNGKLLSTKEDGSNATFHWKEELPHPSYLTSFVAGRFSEVKQEAEGVQLHYYFPESKREDVMRYFGETPRMVKVFNELTGVKYPYQKYAQTTVEEFFYGGMENFNATTLSMTYYHDADSDEDFQPQYSKPNRNAVNLVAHELAHQWFGDLVTCVEWSHAWLNEGFAEYMQALYIEKTRGVDAFRWEMIMKAGDFFEDDATEYRRATVEKNYVYPDDLFDTSIYEKGAWMLHELRHLMGDNAFFGGVSEYLKAHSFANADTHDFRKSMEKVSGLSLEEFFEQSFFRPGFPEFQVEYTWDEESSAATLHVKQTQKLELQTPIFKLPCDVVLYISGTRVKKRVFIGSADQTFVFALGLKPSIVEFDPQRWLLKKVSFKKSIDLLINQLDGSEDASSRAEAAKDLGDLKSNLAVLALKRAAAKEQFWEVNASALKALGEIGTTEALDALLELSKPSNRRTRRALAEALANFKEERACSLLTDLLQNDPSPYVRCEAALSLAKAWPDGAFATLKEAMKAHSPNETLAEACLEAMGKLKDGAVVEVIKENIRYGKPTRVRIGALKAITGRGHVRDEEVPMVKEILLRDKEFRVREYLIAKLIPSVGDRRFLDAVKESSKSDRDPRIKRKALAVYYELSGAAETSSAISKLREEVEKLKEQNTRLAQASGAAAHQ